MYQLLKGNGYIRVYHIAGNTNIFVRATLLLLRAVNVILSRNKEMEPASKINGYQQKPGISDLENDVERVEQFWRIGAHDEALKLCVDLAKNGNVIAQRHLAS